MKKFFFYILIILSILKFQVLTIGCANIVPPQGGFRDSIPPLLIKANPVDSARNFTGKRITFSFDEFVNVDNIQENLIVSPTPNINPFVDFKLNTVTVRLKDTLEDNTTYSLNFGNAIKDVNESNVLKNFTYIFSTGPYIDSLELHGKVILAETGKPDSTLIAMLHTSSDDSAVIKNKPRYIAKLDSAGNFTFKNLPPATYYLYALRDEGGTRRYFSDKQLFAFADKPVTVQLKTEPVTLYAYASKEKEKTQQSTTAPTSTLPQGLNFGNRNRSNPAAEKRLRYQTNLINNQQDLLSDFIMSFDHPLKNFDSSKVSVSTDSTFTRVTGYKFIRDSSNKKLILTNTWKENTVYHLILDKDFANDSSGRKLLKTDTLTFTTNKISDYGKLKIVFHNLDLAKSPVLQFITNNTIFKSFPLSSADFSQSLFLPGEYELRILYDDNKNGVWDAGQFFGKHQQPEIVRPVNRRITVRKSWDNEIDIPL
jgi:hypothetical protein